MKGKKLLSILVSAVLLCACIAGVLVMGSSASTESATYVVGTGEGQYENIRDALRAAADVAKNEGWAADAKLVIEFTGTDTSALLDAKDKLSGESTLLMFGQPTIFRSNGTKLPITIKGTAADCYSNEISFIAGASTASPKQYAFANDYVFEDLYFAAARNNDGDNSVYLFAGSGNVEFQNVQLVGKNMAWADT